MSLILNKSQAEAVYSAMCALNNVSLNNGISVSFVGASCDSMVRYTVTENAAGEVEITEGPMPLCRTVEQYSDQNAFAAAYGLLSDEPQSAAAAAGGLTQTAIER